MTDDQSRPEASDGQPPPALPPLRNRRGLWIGLAVLVAAAIGAALAVALQSGAESPPQDAILAGAAQSEPDASPEAQSATEPDTPSPPEPPSPQADAPLADATEEPAPDGADQQGAAQQEPPPDDEDAADAPRPPSPDDASSQAQSDQTPSGDPPSGDPPSGDPPPDGAAAEPPPTAPPSDPIDAAALGFGPFQRPIAGACFPDFPGQLPGAPRAYRNGIHEGVDFYPGWACAAIVLGTPVLAIGDGTVIRADWEYEDLTTDHYFEMEARGFSGPDDLDTFRGRQVWVDHGGDIVARYAHLSGIAAEIAPGSPVRAGDVLGFVGESGTPGSLREAGSEIHLHFELRIGEGYLGQGERPARAVALYRAVFP